MKAMGDSQLGKIQQGDQFMKDGDALTKKTFTRWKPEWVGAALCFENAAKVSSSVDRTTILVQNLVRN